MLTGLNGHWQEAFQACLRNLATLCYPKHFPCSMVPRLSTTKYNYMGARIIGLVQIWFCHAQMVETSPLRLDKDFAFAFIFPRRWSTDITLWHTGICDDPDI
uniref:Uncharacterized protein n=1 Tax=Romanomermis culicivorax TaxID=13658 RepID=A0A915IUA7_ROMCU